MTRQWTGATLVRRVGERPHEEGHDMDSTVEVKDTPTPARGELEIDKLFRALVRLKGSDLHLRVDCQPSVRVRGTLRPLNRGPVGREEMERLCFPLLDERNRRIFEAAGGTDFAYAVD